VNNYRGIVFFAWGDDWIERAAASIRESKLPEYPVFLVTDPTTDTKALPKNVEVVRLSFQLSGKARKAELFALLPSQIDTALFIDADTRVVDDISLGFDKAEQHGIAIAPAPHYSLADFRDFRQVMNAEAVTPRGQVVYNTGVIFATPQRPEVRAVFDQTLKLAQKYQDKVWNEQPYFSLAMEMLNFNPYALSPSFNHRGFGELISGSIRIWHSYEPVPSDAANLEKGYLHRYDKGKLVKAVKVPL
jgi:hypothetical protein